MNIGILGGGQLGRMLALAGHRLGFTCRLVDPAPDAPAGQVASCARGEYTDLPLLQEWTRDLNVVTFESENVPVETIRCLTRHIPVFPGPDALATMQDRLLEKRMFQRYAIPTVRFKGVSTWQELQSAVEEIGFPCVLKTRRFGYDGKGQAVIRSMQDAEEAWLQLGGSSLVLEAFVRWDREISLIAVRDRQGKSAFYPLVENHHEGGILRLTRAPAPSCSPDLQAQAESYATRILNRFQYVGVLAIEFFQCGDMLLANETAPRVHNSGHWTIEGAETSQFENHLRAIAGLPLGSTACLGHSAMVNLIGMIPPRSALLSVPGASLHLYGKEPRPGRKVGHVTLQHADEGVLNARLAELQERHRESVLEPLRIADFHHSVRRPTTSTDCASVRTVVSARAQGPV